MFLRYVSAVAIGVATAGPASAASSFQPFIFQDTLGNGFSQALGINDSNQIVGQDQAIFGDGPYVISAVVAWSEETLAGKELADVGGRYTNGDTVINLPFDVALGINASGQAVGFSLGGNAADQAGSETNKPVTGNAATVLATIQAPSDAVVWSVQSGSGVALKDVGGQGVSAADAINNAGQIVGFSKTAGGQDAVLWSASNPRAATVLADVGAQGSSAASGINKSGQVVGYSKTAGGGQEAVLWSAATGTGKALEDLGGLGSSVANAINDSGEIVGATTVGDTGALAVVWSASTGTGDFLDTPYDTSSDALAVNDAGEVVGYTLSASGVTEAALWSSTGVETDLASILGPDWKDTEATGVNDEGDIVGFGQYMGGSFNGALGLGDTAFLLVPTASPPAPAPEASTWAMMLLGFAGLGFAGSRRLRVPIRSR